MRKFIVRLLSTFFFVGSVPFIPGTFGSAAGIGVYFLTGGNQSGVVVAAVIVLVAGFWSAGRMETLLGKKDASCIVIDEVAGILISFMFIPFEPRYIILGFFVFRLLDTFKPFPAGRLQRLRGSTGIMIDDIIAGVYTNLVLQVVFRGMILRGS